jgi:hypothetical protein
MSMWQTVKNEGKNLASFNHWPNPFANTIRNIDVLACENTPIAKIKLAFVLFGNAYATRNRTQPHHRPGAVWYED